MVSWGETDKANRECVRPKYSEKRQQAQRLFHSTTPHLSQMISKEVVKIACQQLVIGSNRAKGVTVIMMETRSLIVVIYTWRARNVVGLLSLVDGQKAPFRKRNKGRGRAETGFLLGQASVFGRPRRLGVTHAGGGIRKVSNSRTLQTGSVSPLAMAGVTRTSPWRCCDWAALRLNS
jgi:hypothetical protein